MQSNFSITNSVMLAPIAAGFQVKDKGKAVPLQAWAGPEVPRSWGSQISRQSAHEGGKFVSLYAPAAFTPKEIFLILISVRGWVNPRVIVLPEGLCQWKIPMTPSGIERATFRLVAQCLNELRHRVPLAFRWRSTKSDITSWLLSKSTVLDIPCLSCHYAN